MTREISAMLACAAALLLPGVALAQAPPASGVTTDVIGRVGKTVLNRPLIMPDSPDVVLSTATFAPGARLPEHKHPFPHLVYVMEGTLTVTNTESGETNTYPQGSFIGEMQGTWHYGSNQGTAPLKLLLIDEVPHGASSNTVVKRTN